METLEKPTEQKQQRNYLHPRLIGKMEQLVAGVVETDSGDYEVWVNFREGIYEKILGSQTEVTTKFREDYDFIYGLSVMNKVIDRLIVISRQTTNEETHKTKDYDFGKTEDGDYYIYLHSIPCILLGAKSAAQPDEEWETEKTLDAFRKLYEAFVFLLNSDFWRDDEDKNSYHAIEMDAMLTGIIHAQEFILGYKYCEK